MIRHQLRHIVQHAMRSEKPSALRLLGCFMVEKGCFVLESPDGGRGAANLLGVGPPFIPVVATFNCSDTHCAVLLLSARPSFRCSPAKHARLASPRSESEPLP